jgi:hypothetical protein
MRFSLLLLGPILLGLFAPAPRVAAVTAADDKALIQFPEKITFQVSLASGAEINEVILEYGVEQLTCVPLDAEALPDFAPANNLDVQWTWEMKQSGSLPPGAVVWWRWHVKDAAGTVFETPRQTITWIDQEHAWQEKRQGRINLHWYQGDDSYVTDLLENGNRSLEKLESSLGLKADGSINVYIYPDSKALTDAVYYLPDWTGGLAYPENAIVLIGIAANELNWGKHAETHELTHVLAGRLAFSCLADLPNWLDEGLAQYSEGEWDKESQQQLKDAVKQDQIFSVRALASSFPEDSTQANLAYTQSQSVVTFLVEQYGAPKLLALLATIREGASIDNALQQEYGFDQDGLEDAWRAHVGAVPRSRSSGAPSATLLATAVPTIAPISGIPPVLTQAAGAPAAAQPAEASPDGFWHTSSSWLLVYVCLGSLGAGGVVVLGLVAFLVINQRRQRENR